jgi:uncharacterized membrane protein YeaQ/YmgE (transglycosylase-associated protein family)
MAPSTWAVCGAPGGLIGDAAGSGDVVAEVLAGSCGVVADGSGCADFAAEAGPARLRRFTNPGPGCVPLGAPFFILRKPHLYCCAGNWSDWIVHAGSDDGENGKSIIWTIIIGLIAGVIAKFITPGDNEPSGFILTTILGIVGAFVATYLGQAIGWYKAEHTVVGLQ